MSFGVHLQARRIKSSTANSSAVLIIHVDNVSGGTLREIEEVIKLKPLGRVRRTSVVSIISQISGNVSVAG